MVYCPKSTLKLTLNAGSNRVTIYECTENSINVIQSYSDPCTEEIFYTVSFFIEVQFYKTIEKQFSILITSRKF